MIQTFDRVVMINLASRPERLAAAHREMLAAQWPFRAPDIFVAVDGRAPDAVPPPSGWQLSRGCWGCLQSHRAVTQQAVRDGISSLLILEDDICFSDDFLDRVGPFMRAVPADWDGLLFGGHHLNHRPPPITISPGIVRVMGADCVHAYALRGRYLAAVADALQRNDGNPDHIISFNPGIQAAHRVFAPDPFFIGQEAGISDNLEPPSNKTVRRFWPCLHPHHPSAPGPAAKP